jgi:hypothetical protein
MRTIEVIAGKAVGRCRGVEGIVSYLGDILVHLGGSWLPRAKRKLSSAGRPCDGFMLEIQHKTARLCCTENVWEYT